MTPKNVEVLEEKMAEQVLVVPRCCMRNFLVPKGIVNCKETDVANAITDNSMFLPRSNVETNVIYKQIIPYLILSHKEKLFLMQRAATASEQRLASKYTLGVGGHLRAQDITYNELFAWTKREFLEEINFDGKFHSSFLGVLNDDSNEVGKVHVGLLWLLKTDSPNISIKDELVSGRLLDLEDCLQQYQQLESWSQIVIEHLDEHGF